VRAGTNRQERCALKLLAIDLDMLEFAGVGVAMGNALDEGKAAANCITEPNNNGGGVKAISRFVLSG